MNRLFLTAMVLSAAAGTSEGAGDVATDAGPQVDAPAAPGKLLSGSIRDPKPGTMRHVIIQQISEHGHTTKADLFKRWPSWTDKNFTDCMNILRKRYGYNMQVADDGTVTVGPSPEKGQPATKPVVRAVANVAGQATGGGPDPVIDQPGAGSEAADENPEDSEQESEIDNGQPAPLAENDNEQPSVEVQQPMSKRAQKRAARASNQG